MSKLTIDTTNASYCDTSNLNCKCYDDAYLLPLRTGKGGITDANHQYIKSSSTQHIRGAYSFTETDVTNHTDKAILLGVFSTFVWGHCFSEHFGKLWFLHTEKCKRLISEGAEIVFISVNDIYPSYFYNLFNLAGFDINTAKCITSITQYKELYVPDDSFFSKEAKEPRFFHPEYLDTIRCIQKNVKKGMKHSDLPLYQKLYLTRTQGYFSSTLRDVGEKRIENIFKEIGFHVVAPEKFSVAEQIWMLMNCHDIATTEGSISHAAVFCMPNTHLYLLRKADWVSMHQLAINEAADLSVTYIDAHHSCFCHKTEPWHGPFFMYMTPELKRFFGYRYNRNIPYFLNPLFLLYCIREIYVRTLRKNKWIDCVVRKIISK